MELLELLKLLRAGEGPHLEFKREFPPQAHDLAKEMTALANTGGGVLLLGVDDNEFRLACLSLSWRWNA